MTPSVVATIGPKECEVRVQIGIKDLTTTVTKYNFFLNTMAEKSLCFGPGVLPDQQADKETRFIIQTRNTAGENRQSGRDEFAISVQRVLLNEDGSKKGFEDLPFELTDLNTGQYEVKYLSEEGELKIDVKFIEETGNKRPVRGSPFKPTFSSSARNRANEYAGPLITSWIGNTMKSLEEFYSTTNSGHSAKLKDGDVKGLIKIMNHIDDMVKQEDALILQQDELYEMFYHLDKKEGLPSDKQMKQLKKIGVNLTQLKIDIEAKEKDIAPMKQKESDLYRKKIADFEEN